MKEKNIWMEGDIGVELCYCCCNFLIYDFEYRSHGGTDNQFCSFHTGILCCDCTELLMIITNSKNYTINFLNKTGNVIVRSEEGFIKWNGPYDRLENCLSLFNQLYLTE